MINPLKLLGRAKFYKDIKWIGIHLCKGIVCISNKRRMRNFSQSSKELSGRILKRPNNICHILLHVQSGGRTEVHIYIGLYIICLDIIHKDTQWQWYMCGDGSGSTKNLQRKDRYRKNWYIHMLCGFFTSWAPGKAYIDNIIYLLYIITEVNNNLINFIYKICILHQYITHTYYMSYISPFFYIYIYV